jgi:fluoroquinolone transport system permease protein
MVGFLLLDEKDERTLLALLVSPLPLSHFLLYRAALPTVLGMAVTLLTFPLTNLVQIGLAELLLVCFLAALTGPINALFLAAFAGNKVAGLNVLKFVNLVMLLPIVAFLVPMPVQLWAGLIPHYWGMKVFVQAAEGEAYWAYALVAALYSLTLIALLLWQFRRSIRA